MLFYASKLHASIYVYIYSTRFNYENKQGLKFMSKSMQEETGAVVVLIANPQLQAAVVGKRDRANNNRHTRGGGGAAASASTSGTKVATKDGEESGGKIKIGDELIKVAGVDVRKLRTAQIFEMLKMAVLHSAAPLTLEFCSE